MKVGELRDKSILLLGFGQEGIETYRFLRHVFPSKHFGIADRSVEAIRQVAKELQTDNVSFYLGDDYDKTVIDYEVIIKTPGIPLISPALQTAISSGKTITSHTALFLENCPGVVIGITGTKGKSTTTSLIYSILQKAGLDTHLVGNIGNPPLGLLNESGDKTHFVYEMSSFQLENVTGSPHVAVLLNIVPEHLDTYPSFDEYVNAKANITKYQTSNDYLVYNSDYEIPRTIAARTRAQLYPFSTSSVVHCGSFLQNNKILFATGSKEEVILTTEEVPLLGAFNLNNVLAAITVAGILGVYRDKIATGVRSFKALEHRFEFVGQYKGIKFYNASIATVPEATIEHINVLASELDTILLGGHDRGLNFTALARRILQSSIKTLILFPQTGERIWNAIREVSGKSKELPARHFVNDMREAVKIAYQVTQRGKTCLHSPASPSYGIFKNFEERGQMFKSFVRELGAD